MTLRIRFRSRIEATPGVAWRAVFEAGWPGWRHWLRQRRPATDDPSRGECEAALARHMPELVSVWQQLIEVADADDEAASFLSFWCPPRFLGSCSQAALDCAGPLLVRNYDLDPRLSEATLLHTAWTGKPVVGMVDGLCGLADGMNAEGLAVSLAYGGRTVVGRGFGVPMVLRYLLETCETVDEATETLRRLPHHMSYNLTMIDRSGAAATVHLAPDRPLTVAASTYATNHQAHIEDQTRARACQSEERAATLDRMTRARPTRAADVIKGFLTAPLFTRQIAEQFATVYTAAYRPRDATVALHWPGGTTLHHDLHSPIEAMQMVEFGAQPSSTDAVAAPAEPIHWIHWVPEEVRELVRLACGMRTFEASGS